MNKKLVKGIQQLGIETKARLAAMHLESKSKMNNM